MFITNANEKNENIIQNVCETMRLILNQLINHHVKMPWISWREQEKIIFTILWHTLITIYWGVKKNVPKAEYNIHFSKVRERRLFINTSSGWNKIHLLVETKNATNMSLKCVFAVFMKTSCGCKKDVSNMSLGCLFRTWVIRNVVFKVCLRHILFESQSIYIWLNRLITII